MPLAVNEPAEVGEIYHQDGEPLADVIMQFPGDSRTLLLLRAEQPRAEIAHARVAAAESRVSVFPLFPLKQQRGDEDRLCGECDDRDNDVQADNVPRW